MFWFRISGWALFRSSHQRCSVKKCVLRYFAKFTGKHLCQRFFFNKKVFFLRTPFYRHLRMTASIYFLICEKKLSKSFRLPKSCFSKRICELFLFRTMQNLQFAVLTNLPKVHEFFTFVSLTLGPFLNNFVPITFQLVGSKAELILRYEIIKKATIDLCWVENLPTVYIEVHLTRRLTVSQQPGIHLNTILNR